MNFFYPVVHFFGYGNLGSTMDSIEAIDLGTFDYVIVGAGSPAVC